MVVGDATVGAAGAGVPAKAEVETASDATIAVRRPFPCAKIAFLPETPNSLRSVEFAIFPDTPRSIFPAVSFAAPPRHRQNTHGRMAV
jgi:hypothetical protein